MEAGNSAHRKNLDPQISKVQSKLDLTMQAIYKYDPNLDPMYMKRKYFKKLRKIYKQYRDIVHLKDWHELSLQEQIAGVKNLGSTTKNLKVDVIQQNGEDILIVKRNNPDDSIIRILSAEECFPVILKAHIESMHGDAQAIQSITECYYKYPLVCITLVLQSCKVCNNVSRPFSVLECKEIETNKSTWKVMIYKMKKIRRFNYVFIYMEVVTKYTIIRPLTTLAVDELGMELMKVFTTFGTPKNIFVTTDYEHLLQKALKMLVTIDPSYMVQVQKCYDYIFDVGSVITAFKKWFKQTGCKDWITGCRIVQWQYNTSLRVISQKSAGGLSIKSGVPYNLFFGSEANAFSHNNGDIVSEQLNSKSCHGITFEIEGEKTDRLLYLSSDESDDDTAELDIVRCGVCNEEFTMYTCVYCHKPLHYKCRRTISSASVKKLVCKNC